MTKQDRKQFILYPLDEERDMIGREVDTPTFLPWAFGIWAMGVIFGLAMVVLF